MFSFPISHFICIPGTSFCNKIISHGLVCTMETASTADSWCAPWTLPVLRTVGVHHGNCQYCGQLVCAMKTANTADSWCAPWKLPILWTVGVHYGNCQYCGQPYFAGAAILKDGCLLQKHGWDRCKSLQN